MPTTKQNIYDQLNKLNNTPYRIGNFIVNLDDKAFIPLKEINELRRKAIANLDSIRLYRKTSLNKPNNIIPQKFDLHRPEISVQVYTQEQYEAAKELEIEHIYYKNFIHRNNPKYIDDDKEILFGGLGSIDYYKDKNKILVSDYSLNVTNYETVAILSSLGVNRITLSQEICKDNINKLIENYFSKYLTYPNLELIVYGRTCLMHSRYCPLKRLNMCGKCKINKYALKDRFATFPITFNSDCTTNIWNSKILNNMDDLDPSKAGYVPSSGYLLKAAKVGFNDGETVLDVLKRACDKYGIQLEYSYTPMYGSSYIEGIGNLYEFDCGPQSGWMYKVNGWFPNYGCSAYKVSNGDSIAWCYTCKGLGEDLGAAGVQQ